MAATTFAAMVLLASESIEVTGRVASLLLAGSSTGGMTGPLLVGQLFDRVTPMCLVYVLVGVSLAHIGVFMLMLLFARRYDQSVDRQRTGFNGGLTVVQDEPVELCPLRGEEVGHEMATDSFERGSVEQRCCEINAIILINFILFCTSLRI